MMNAEKKRTKESKSPFKLVQILLILQIGPYEIYFKCGFLTHLLLLCEGCEVQR